MSNKKLAGVDVLLKVKKGEQYIPVCAQKGLSLSRSAETIDVTDKTSGGYSESLVGLKSWGIETDGWICLGNESYELLLDAFDNREKIDVEIKVGDENGFTYKGQCVITDFPEEFPMDDAISFSLSLAGASPLVRTNNRTLSVAKTK